MRSVCIIFFVALLVTGVFAADQPQPIDSDQRTLLLRDWKTVRFGAYLSMSDYATRGDTILLQRLDAEHAALSVIRERSAREWGLPLLVAVVDEAHATKMVEQAIDFYLAAKGEDPKRAIERNSADHMAMSLDFLTVYGSGKAEASTYIVQFDLHAETYNGFSKFIEEAAKAPKK